MDARTIFEILIREHADMLLAFIRSGIRDEHLVDDIFQETMLTAWKRLDDYDHERPFAPWLRGIAGKLMLSYYRQQRSRGVPLDDAVLTWLGERFERMHRLNGDSFLEKLATLRDCIAALPEHYRSPIELRYGQESSLDAMVASMKLTVETIKKRPTRAKAKLADCLNAKLQQAEIVP
jgi:RNA polymerase sigma factor (sigma-70 family)